ncbi:MAG: prolipoprotein diacylglyceryl transferase [Bdellovibrionaceae bacterium]|nr:prolipoprotein diacylglyceryl transferase [Bdellovibrio sp.]
MVHDLSPFIFKFPETSLWGTEFGFRWYGFSYMLGFICAYYLICWLAERQRAGLTRAMVGDFITYAAIGTLVGGRLGYCLFYDPTLFISFRSAFPFWGVLAVNEGGMASHGGIIGIVIACFLYARKMGLNYVYLLDLAAITGPIGSFFGRLANFINGELVGRTAPADFPLAVKFPSDILNWPTYEFDRLSQLTPVVEKLGVQGSRWSEMLSTYRTSPTSRDGVYGVLYKVIHEIQNGNDAVKAAIAPILDPRHPSQLYAALSEGLITFCILFFLARKSRRPGFIAGSFIITYAIARIINEQFRMPDIQIGFQALGLTRGQWLSVAMLLVGIIAIFYWTRTQSQTVFGWKRGESVRVGRR